MWFCTWLIFVYVWTAFGDPGYRSKDIYSSEIELRKQKNDYLYCKQCNSWKTDKAIHCQFCNRCSVGFDHHCNIVGNCISKNNLWAFRLWIISMFLSFF